MHPKGFLPDSSACHVGEGAGLYAACLIYDLCCVTMNKTTTTHYNPVSLALLPARLEPEDTGLWVSAEGRPPRSEGLKGGGRCIEDGREDEKGGKGGGPGRVTDAGVMSISNTPYSFKNDSGSVS